MERQTASLREVCEGGRMLSGISYPALRRACAHILYSHTSGEDETHATF